MSQKVAHDGKFWRCNNFGSYLRYSSRAKRVDSMPALDLGRAKTPNGPSRRGFLFFADPAERGILGSRRFAAEIWRKRVLTAVDASEFSHGQDPQPTSRPPVLRDAAIAFVLARDI
jgi:hypothetical protein